MPEATWYFVSVLESTSSLEKLTEKFHQLCCLQPGVKNHGWRVVTVKPRRYLFQLISRERLSQDSLFDLSMLVQEEGSVIAEATNCVSEEVPLLNLVFVIDTGVKLIGRNPTLDTFEQHLDEHYKISYLDGFMTLSFSTPNVIETFAARKYIEGLIRSSGRMTLIATFNNWKD